VFGATLSTTFEAYVLENKDIKNTTLFLARVEKMAGVDAEEVDAFTPVNDSHNMQMLGLSYEGIENLELSVWYYHLKDAEIDSISYLEAQYEGVVGGIGYGLGLQYAKQSYSVAANASVFGATLSTTFEAQGLTLAFAYNQSKDNAATSGFGGGPFFSNSEYLIIDNAGKDGTQTWFGLEFDASTIGVEGLTLGLSKATLENEAHQKATEVDFVASYAMSKSFEMHLIYTDLKGRNVGEDDAKHLRVFANYAF
jgi:predicted porin